MSSDWPVVRLGDHVEACLGKMLDKKKNKGTNKPYLGNSNVRWGEFDLAELSEMKFEEGETERYGLRSGDLIVCEGGEPGRCAIWNEELPEMKIQKALHRLRTKPSLNNKYLYYWFLRAGQVGSLEPYFTGTTIKHLTGKALSNLELRLPPIATQVFVSEVLGSLDEKIQQNKKINQTLEQMAQAIFKSWFVDFEPVKAKIAALEAGGTEEDALIAAMQAISGKDKVQLARFKTEQPEQYNELRTTAELFPSAMQNSELGEIPESWAISTVGEEFDVTMGQSPPSDTYNEIGEGTPFFQGRRDFGTRFPRERVYCSAPKRMAKKGDTLLSVRAPVGDSNIALVDCCIGRGLAALRHKTQSPSFTYYSVIQLKRSLSSFNSEGTVFGSINQKNLKSLTVIKPSNQTLSIFDKVVSSFDLTIQTLSEQTQTLEQIRDGLLPKLLSGEIGADSLGNRVGQSSIDSTNEQLYSLIQDIEKELPAISHFKDSANFVEESFIVYEPRQAIKKRSFTTNSLLVKGESAEGGAEYFKLPAFLSALRNNKTLDKLFAAVVDGISGVPLLMDAVTAVMSKYLGRKIRLNQRTAIVLLAFPKKLTRRTSELLENARRVALNSGLSVIDEDELYFVLQELKKHGLVEQVRFDTEQWKLVEKFRHEIDHWQ